MTLRKSLAIGLAVLLVSAGAAATVPADDHADAVGDTPAEEHANEHTAGDAGDRADAAHQGNSDAQNESASAADGDRRGPPADMPAPVPDHVGQIHDRIEQFLGGELDDLGAAVSDLVGGAADAADADGPDAEGPTNATE